MRLILFDCDGTIADSFGLIVEVMRRAFVEHGLPAPEDAATRGIIGLSLGVAIARLAPSLSPADVDELTANYRTAFHLARTELDHREILFPGALELLRVLHRRDDVLLGMVTGKSHRGVDAVVAAHDLDGVFQVVRTADDCPSKPHPAMVEECCAELGFHPGQAVVIGDATFDMMMAKAAGAHAIGVTWGAADRAALRAAGADTVVETMDALHAAIDLWLARPTEAAVPASELL